MKKVYILQSKKNKKYLSNLFKDKHADKFKATRLSVGDIYFYSTEQIAKEVAETENAIVINCLYDVQTNTLSIE